MEVSIPTEQSRHFWVIALNTTHAPVLFLENDSLGKIRRTDRTKEVRPTVPIIHLLGGKGGWIPALHYRKTRVVLFQMRDNWTWYILFRNTTQDPPSAYCYRTNRWTFKFFTLLLVFQGFSWKKATNISILPGKKLLSSGSQNMVWISDPFPFDLAEFLRIQRFLCWF